MTGKVLYWKKSCKIQVHEYGNVANTLEEKTQGVISLGPTGNLHITYNFFLLSTIKNHPRTVHRGAHSHNRYRTGDGDGLIR